VTQHPDLKGLRRFTLGTRDAHGLYSQFGFAPVRAPERAMEIVRPDVYRGSNYSDACGSPPSTTSTVPVT
jgi:hypothetical protein